MAERFKNSYVVSEIRKLVQTEAAAAVKVSEALDFFLGPAVTPGIRMQLYVSHILN